MEINTLVRHKKLTSLGIGCISKVMKSSYKVNFGVDDCITCKESMLIPVDVSSAKTLPFDDFRRMSVCNSKDLPGKVIIGNEVKEWIGIGWISQGVVDEDDLKKYPRIV